MEKGDIKILSTARFPTLKAEEVIPQMADWFKSYDIKGLGIATFGPVDLRKESPTYGTIKATPKEGWQNVDFVTPFKEALSVPVELDTDVNGAALGEAIYGAGRNLSVITYMTVGTGIGVGLYVEGNLLHGLMHPEAGHMLVMRHPRDTYKGSCPFHNDQRLPAGCLEGYACGLAIKERWGVLGETLTERPEVWEMEAYYLAQGISNLILLYSPEKVIIGGGVMHQKGLIEMVREKAAENLSGYLQCEPIIKDIENYIVPPALGDKAGLTGAIELGRRAAE